MYFFTPYLLPGQTSLVLTMCSSLTDQESHNKQLLLFYKHSCFWSLTRSIFPLFLFPWNKAMKEQGWRLSENMACFKDDGVMCTMFVFFDRKLFCFSQAILLQLKVDATQKLLWCFTKLLFCLNIKQLIRKQRNAKENKDV